MSYSDVINSLKLHGGALNQTAANWANIGNNMQSQLGATTAQSQGVNPWSSEAYVPKTYRDIYSEYSDVVDPRSAFNTYNDLSGGEKFGINAAKGLTGFQMGSQISPYLAGTKLTNKAGETMWGLGKGQSFNLGPSMAVRSFTNDMNPYTYTSREGMGNTASNMMMAHQVSKMIPALNAGSALALSAPATATSAAVAGINPMVALAALAFSMFQNKKRRRRAKQKNLEAIQEVETAQAEQYEDRSQKLQDMRDDMLSQQTNRLWQQDASRYSNQYGGNYSNRFADEGMKFSPKELKKIAKAGRNGDTQLAHINPQEAQMLKAMGGSGTINPYTGLREYGWLNSFVSSILGGATNVVGGVLDAGGDILSGTLDAGSNILTDVSDQVVFPVLDPVFDATDKVMQPAMQATSDIVRPVMEGVGNVVEGGIDMIGNVGMQGVEALHGGAEWVGGFINDIFENIFGMDNDPYQLGGMTQIPGELQRESLKKQLSNREDTNLQLSQAGLANLTKENKAKYQPGDWVGDKPNPYIAANVEEELDVMAHGGKMDIIAEFTGNELIVNDQDKVEKGLASGNYAMAAAPIRRAMKKKQLTPGQETHQGNPMPVDSEGNIYAGGGKLNFKVNKGAGVYDHATDQFKPTMTDREIAMVAHNNINKWESNGMA